MALVRSVSAPCLRTALREDKGDDAALRCVDPTVRPPPPPPLPPSSGVVKHVRAASITIAHQTPKEEEEEEEEGAEDFVQKLEALAASPCPHADAVGHALGAQCRDRLLLSLGGSTPPPVPADLAALTRSSETACHIDGLRKKAFSIAWLQLLGSQALGGAETLARLAKSLSMPPPPPPLPSWAVGTSPPRPPPLPPIVDGRLVVRITPHPSNVLLPWGRPTMADDIRIAMPSESSSDSESSSWGAPRPQQQVQDEDTDDEDDGGERKTCMICYDDVRASRMVDFAFGACQCAGTACRGCVRRYLSMSIREGDVFPLRCMMCNENPHDLGDALPASFEADLACTVASIVRPDQFERFLRFRTLKATPGAVECPNCGTIDVRKRRSPKVTCSTCEHEYCAEHEDAHPNESCRSFRKRTRDSEGSSKRWKSKHAVKCPKCKVVTEKESGCNHMTCRCGANWCWLCGRAFKSTSRHYGSMNIFGCPGGHFSDSRVSVWPKRIGIVVGTTVAVALSPLVIPAAIIGGPVLFAKKAIGGCRRRRRVRRRNQQFNANVQRPDDDW